MDILELDDTKIDVVTLSYATRLIFSELDVDLIVKRSLDSIAAVTGSPHLAIMLLDQESFKLQLLGMFSPDGFSKRDDTFSMDGSPLEDLVFSKVMACFSLSHKYPIPWPGEPGDSADKRCLCVPLVASNNKVVGVVTMEVPECFSPDDFSSIELRILLTVVAVALETARLFRTAVFDSLTGLHIRRYFEYRLTEEEARIKRYGGMVSLLVLDIDRFKDYNDAYGHQQGDLILQESARIMKESCRLGIDLVSRYGGEEFVIMLPETDLKGAAELAERIRQKMEKHPFPGPDKPLKVTLSVGLAHMNQDNLLGDRELFRRADAALYKAKRFGRNRIAVWEDETTME